MRVFLIRLNGLFNLGFCWQKFEIIIGVIYYADMNISKFIIGILLIIPGALMIVDVVLAMMGNKVIFFEGVNSRFELVVGYALIILGASNIDSKGDK